VLGGLELRGFAFTVVRVAVASAALAGVAYLVWSLLDDALGRDLFGQIVSMTAALAAGAVVYGVAAAALRVPELAQIRRLLPGGRAAS
jgi:hypothetical protein